MALALQPGPLLGWQPAVPVALQPHVARSLLSLQPHAATTHRAPPSRSSLLQLTAATPDEVTFDSPQKGAAATSYYQPLQAGDVLESTPFHRRACAAAVAAAAGIVIKLVVLLNAFQPSLSLAAGLAASAVAGVSFADFGSGVYHWAMDNYGNAETPVFGKQIEAFQGHHERPWTITYRQTCNNLHLPALSGLPPLLGFLLFVPNVYWLTFGLFATSLIIFSQELHKWSHTVPRQAPPVANWLQSVGLAVSRRDHLSHHRSPFDTNYCIVSGAWNGVLDATNFFPRLERLIHKLNGIQPRSWTNERFEFEGAEGLRPGGDSSPAATKASV